MGTGVRVHANWFVSVYQPLFLNMSKSNSFLEVDPAILNDLANYDSATVQNAAILVRGYAPAGEDYTGPDLEQLLQRQVV